METSYHLILQNTKDICWYSIFHEVLQGVAIEVRMCLGHLLVQYIS